MRSLFSCGQHRETAPIEKQIEGGICHIQEIGPLLRTCMDGMPSFPSKSEAAQIVTEALPETETLSPASRRWMGCPHRALKPAIRRIVDRLPSFPSFTDIKQASNENYRYKSEIGPLLRTRIDGMPSLPSKSGAAQNITEALGRHIGDEGHWIAWIVADGTSCLQSLSIV